MATLRYIHADVFTDRGFGGNQLAVFLEADQLSRETMELLAKEMNFSESTFVQRTSLAGCAARVRICIPGKEIPFAGHPTVGTAAVLHLQGGFPAETSLELGVGPVPVRVERTGERSARAWMMQPKARLGSAMDAGGEAALALGLPRADVSRELPIRVVSSGLPILVVAVRTRAALAGLRLDRSHLDPLLLSAGVDAIYVYTLDSPDPGAHVHARMFAPMAGISEDPATGSAAGPLAAHLAEAGVVDALPGRTLVVRQGLEMGRASTLECLVIGSAEDFEGVRVGGGVVVVGEGSIFLDDPGPPR